MTTHIVEISHPTKPAWIALTTPIAELDAKHLCNLIGGGWQSRIIPVAPPSEWEADELVAMMRWADPNQLERYKAGVLPVEELRTILGRAMFAESSILHHEPLTSPAFRRWRKLEIKHHPDCGAKRPHEKFSELLTVIDDSKITWEVDLAVTITGNQWFAIRDLQTYAGLIRAAANAELGFATTRPEVRIMATRHHRGLCTECGGEASGVSAQIEIWWGPHRMTREYAL